MFGLIRQSPRRKVFPKVKELPNTPMAKTTGFVTDKPKPKAKDILTNTPNLFRMSEANIKGVSNTLKPKAMSTISKNRKNNNNKNTEVKRNKCSECNEAKGNVNTQRKQKEQ